MGNVSLQPCKASEFTMDKHKINMGPGDRLPSLDGLRALSIGMVVIGHCSQTVRPLSRSATLMLGFVEVSRLGVSVFFVISGFLITTLLVREQQITQSINLKHFYIRRALRIFPGFYAYWLVALALTLLGYIHLSHSDLIGSAVYIWNYVPRKADTWFLNHTWSLSIEEQFYLLWPLILKFSGPKRGKWATMAVIIVAPIIRVASYFFLPSTRSRIAMMLHTRADSLMVGALLALVFLNEDHLRVLKRLASSWLIPVASLCFAAIDTLLTVHFQGQYLLPIGYSLQNLVIALLIAHIVLNDKTRLGRTLNNSAVVHVGVISYSLYLWQQLFLKTANTTFTGTFPWNIMCAFLAAELSYYLLEKPFLRLRKRFSNVPGDVTPPRENTPLEPETGRLAAAASASS
jgi:peptidoglycan/LPS O-acetylase OafA/YrhL